MLDEDDIMNKDSITFPKNSTESIIGFSSTSANVLCKYMTKPEYLHEILRDMAIKPRYVPEIIDYFREDSLQSVSIPMICFCDIPLVKVRSHSQYYGEYGIALDKKKCMTKNVQPITYINVNSRYYEDFSSVISLLMNSDDQPEDKWRALSDFVLTQILYSKPVYGETIKDGEKIQRLFKDECEWRYIPKLPDDMELVLINKKNTNEGRDLYNKALSSNSNKSTWLSFVPDDISFLIVPDENAAIELIEYISKELSFYDEKIRHRLISKIEVSSKIDKNFI